MADTDAAWLTSTAGLELLALQQSSDDAIIGKTVDGVIRSWNPAAERIFGYASTEMIGSSALALVPPELQDEEHGLLARVCSGDRVTRHETTRLRKDGQRIAVSLTLAPVCDADGTLIAVSEIGRDITPLRALEDRVRQAQKMEALGRLAGGVAHDFNNILTIIGGFTAFLARDIAPESPAHPDLLGIQHATERASRLTQQLLGFSRSAIPRLELLDLAVVVSDTATMLRPLLPEHVRLEVRLDTRPAWTRADAGQVSQILLNLATNARDAMPEGGTLTVRVFDDVPASRVVLTVRDTGHGMDAQTRTQLFEPFFTTKARGQGTGLGLATVFGIVRALGGQIEVDTVPDRGTVFRILLPRAEGAGVVSGPRVASDLHGHETVLVVDDEHTIVELASRTLLEYGYSVVQATGPGAAMVAFAERAGRIDLVLTDIMMPDMTGRALVERLRRRDRGLAVLYMSGYSDPALDEALPADPTDPLIAKPFTPRQLAEAVRATLASRHPTA